MIYEYGEGCAPKNSRSKVEGCNDPYQIIQVFNKFDQVDQPIVGGAKLTFSRMNNFWLTKTPFSRPRRYEFADRLNAKIRLTDKKLWS